MTNLGPDHPRVTTNFAPPTDLTPTVTRDAPHRRTQDPRWARRSSVRSPRRWSPASAAEAGAGTTPTTARAAPGTPRSTPRSPSCKPTPSSPSRRHATAACSGPRLRRSRARYVPSNTSHAHPRADPGAPELGDAPTRNHECFLPNQMRSPPTAHTRVLTNRPPIPPTLKRPDAQPHQRQERSLR